MPRLRRPPKNIFARGARTRSTAESEQIPDDKGTYFGRCNRSACLKPGAVWFNHSTRKYYCEECAEWLNTDDFNRRDALRLWGHDLCTLGEVA